MPGRSKRARWSTQHPRDDLATIGEDPLDHEAHEHRQNRRRVVGERERVLHAIADHPPSRRPLARRLPRYFAQQGSEARMLADGLEHFDLEPWMVGACLGHLRRNVLGDVGPRGQKEREHAKPGHSVPHRLGRTVEKGGTHELHVRKPNPRGTERCREIRLEPLERSAPPGVTAPMREEDQARRAVRWLGAIF